MKILLALLFALPLLSRAEDAETVCRAHLKRIGGAVRAYRLIHENKDPARLSDLYLEGLVESYGDFVCPSSGTAITLTSEIDTKSDYTLEPLQDVKDLVAREKTPRHAGNILAVFADGAMRLIAMPGPQEAVSASKPAPVSPPPATAATQPPIVPQPATAIAQPPGPPPTTATQPVQPSQPAVVSSTTPPPAVSVGRPGVTVTTQSGSPSLKVIPSEDGKIEVQLIPPGFVVSPQSPAPPPPALGQRAPGYLGISVGNTQQAATGAVVADVTRGGPADTASGLKPGDHIISVNGNPIENARQFADMVGRQSAGSRLELLLYRDGKLQRANLVLGVKPAGKP